MVVLSAVTEECSMGDGAGSGACGEHSIVATVLVEIVLLVVVVKVVVQILKAAESLWWRW